jgi:hypothetical protein
MREIEQKFEYELIPKMVGNFLMTYESDLKYISAFQEWKKRDFMHNDFIKKEYYYGLFQFLEDFKVYKGFNIDQRKKINISIQKYLRKHSNLNVDDFALNIYRGKKMKSMASKIAMLYDPTEFLPLDLYSKKACFENHRYCSYNEFIITAKGIKQKELKKILIYIDLLVKPIVSTIERNNKLDGISITKIRKNRILDKVLWTIGKFKNSI